MTTPRRPFRHALATAVLPLFALPAVAQERQPPPAQGAPDGQEPAPAAVEKLAEWPELAQPERDRVAALVAQFRKAEELHADASSALVALGDGAAPWLFRQLTDLPQNVNDKILPVLDQTLDARHGALLAREARSPKLVLRRYVVRRLCTFVDPDLLPVLQHATKDKDEAVAFDASFGLVALRQWDHLPPVLQRARKDWASLRELAAQVLPKARGRGATDAVLAAVQKGGPLDKMAALRLLRSLAPKEMAATIRVFLDSEDHNVKKEAVNALRAIHGEPPIEDLPVFRAIEMAKEWKTRL